jgi:hypothetical protein
MIQMDLLAYQPPAQRHSETSVDAAESIRDAVPSLQSLVLSAFRRAGLAGMTDPELLAEMIGAGFRGRESTIRARRIELTKSKWAEKCGFSYPPLVDSGGKRKFGTARTDSTVWCLREFVNGEKRA